MVDQFRYVVRKNEYFDRVDLPLRIACTLQANGEHPIHCHEFTEVVIVTGGTAFQVTDFGRYRIESGDVFIIHRNLHHGYSEAKELTLINILFEPQRLPLPLLDLGTQEIAGHLFKQQKTYEPADADILMHLMPEELEKAVRLAVLAEEENNKKQPVFRFSIMAFFMHLLVLLARNYVPIFRKHEILHTIPQALEYLERNYQQHPAMDMLARKIGMSRRNFFRQFKQATGNTPLHYLHQIRLRHAMELLQQSDWSIDEIAMHTGFYDGADLWRKLKRETNLNPSQFRQQAQQKSASCLVP
jgi:AraC-like DNA-binding protein